MSKQWGHGYNKGQVDALNGAAIAVKQLQDSNVYAMALLQKLMMTHQDKKLVNEVHSAMLNGSLGFPVVTPKI